MKDIINISFIFVIVDISTYLCYNIFIRIGVIIMTGKHHLIAGSIAGCCVAASTIVKGDPNVLLIGGTVLTTMVGSLFPDIDSRTSKLGSKMKITSTIASKLFGHRGFLHSPLFAICMFLLCNILFEHFQIEKYSLLYYGFVIGIINHFACDITTKGGIPLLYPMTKAKFSFSPMKSGSKWEFIPLAIVCSLSVILTIVFCYHNTFLP
jgi:inner membrane protein